MVGYHGPSSRSRSQRQSAAAESATQTARPIAPAGWATALPVGVLQDVAPLVGIDDRALFPEQTSGAGSRRHFDLGLAGLLITRAGQGLIPCGAGVNNACPLIDPECADPPVLPDVPECLKPPYQQLLAPAESRLLAEADSVMLFHNCS